MRPMMNALARPMPQQNTMNALAPQNVSGGGNMPGQPFPLTVPGPRPQPPMQGGMPTQEMIDEAWARNPTDMMGEQIDQLVRGSGGALVAPWDRQPQPQMMQPRR